MSRNIKNALEGINYTCNLSFQAEREREARGDNNRKIPLSELPISERPVCRFYAEGKCMKVVHLEI